MPEITHNIADGTTWRSLRDGDVTDPTPALRFPGDPGSGVLLTGGTVFTGYPAFPSGIQWLDDNTSKRHVLQRGYSGTGNSWPWSGTEGALMHLAVDRLPFITTKFENFSQAQILAGAMDATLDVEIGRIQDVAPAPLWLGYYHEPEDNFEDDAAAAQFRAVCRYIVEYVRPEVTNVAWCFPVWMIDWSFAGGISVRGEAWKWDPDWKGTLSGISGTTAIPNASDWYTGAESVIDILGFDQYSPNIGSTNYRTYSSNFNIMKNKLALWQRPTKPFAIGEIGTKDVPAAVDWVAHFQDFLDSALANDVIGYVYYNTHLNNFFNSDPSGQRKAGYDAMLADPRVLGVDDL